MKVEESVALPVRPEALWPWISTADGLARWITDAKGFETRPAGELEERSHLIVHLPRGAPIEAIVERAERERALVLRARGLPDDLEIVVTFLVSERGEDSSLTIRAEAQLTGLLMFAEKMIASKARAKMESWADALRRAIDR
jgi:carbon monoxide dehydrogenase subunit G